MGQRQNERHAAGFYRLYFSGWQRLLFKWWKRKADANPKGPALSLSVTIKDTQPHVQPPQQSHQQQQLKMQLRLKQLL